LRRYKRRIKGQRRKIMDVKEVTKEKGKFGLKEE
jgi:hypothetical protein